MRPLVRLGQRMARRNNLALFAWIAAILLPIALQLIAGMEEEVRQYLDQYYGPFTLYFFFVMTYGFAVVFVCFYQLSAYRRQGTLDMLRVSRLTPYEVLRDAYLQLQYILLPPILGFVLVFSVYLLLTPERAMLAGFGGGTIIGGLLNVVLTELLLCAVVCLGLLRSEAGLAALAALLVMPLNIAPIIVFLSAQRLRDYWDSHAALLTKTGQGGQAGMPSLQAAYLAAPWLFYGVAVALLTLLLLIVSHQRLSRLWGPQARPLGR